MVTSIDTEKVCDKIQHPPTIKTLSKLGTKWTFLTDKGSLKHTGSIILMVNHRCQLSSLFFDIVL